MEEKEKIQIKFKLAACLRKIIEENKSIAKTNEEKGIENIALVDSVRQLEASSGLSYTIIQKVFAGQRDPQFTSLISIIEDGLEMNLSKFAKIYDSITDEDIKRVKKQISESKKLRKRK